MPDATILRLMRGSPFLTVQGEGVLVGTPSIFIRTAGCDLRCHRDVKSGKYWTCDTLESLPDYDHRNGKFLPTPTPAAHEINVTELAEAVAQWPQSHIVITGGEPMLQAAGLTTFLDRLNEVRALAWSHAAGTPEDRLPFHITLETNARYFDFELAKYISLPSLSPKLQQITQTWPDMSGCPEAATLYKWINHCDEYGKPCQLKIVCCDESDYERAREIFAWAELNSGNNVECIVQPGWAVTDTARLTRVVAQDNKYRVIPQTHKFLEVE